MSRPKGPGVSDHIPIRISDLITSEDKPVMCCICFEAFAIKDLHTLPDGQPEDVCQQCAKDEQAQRKS